MFHSKPDSYSLGSIYELTLFYIFEKGLIDCPEKLYNTHISRISWSLFFVCIFYWCYINNLATNLTTFRTISVMKSVLLKTKTS